MPRATRHFNTLFAASALVCGLTLSSQFQSAEANPFLNFFNEVAERARNFFEGDFTDFFVEDIPEAMGVVEVSCSPSRFREGRMKEMIDDR